MIAEKVAVLYRGGPDSDARYHLAVGDHPYAPLCAGGRVREVARFAYPYMVTLLEPATVPLLRVVNDLAEQLAIRTLGQMISEAQRKQLCQRCAAPMMTVEGPADE